MAMRSSAGWAGGVVAALAIATGASDAAAGDRDAALSIHGAVTDASGAPVPAATVRVLKTRRVRVLGAAPDADQAVEEARGRTDADGRYTIDVQVDHAFPFWFVRFYDPAIFDGVKYRTPQDIDISRQIRAGATIDANAVLQFHPDWPRVKALVEQYGAASRRGQILRSLGLPGKRVPGEGGRESWEYPAAGVAYLLDGDVVVETRRFEPVRQKGKPGDPVPAEKVEGP
jgi:hypothetical protein